MSHNKSALVTGAGSGIGAALATELARRGYGVTVADISGESAERVVNGVRRTGGDAHAVCCDVRDDSAQHAMFEAHLECYGRLDVVCLNAGILEKGWIFSPNEEPWKETMDINLTAQIVGARLAALAMQKLGSKGVLLFTSSAGGIFPMPEAPVYAAAKAGVVSFARSIAPGLAHKGIRVCTLCPNFVETALTRGAVETIEARHGRGPAAEKAKAALFGAAFGDQRMLPMAHVVKGAMYLLEGSAEPGAVLLLPPNRRAYEFHFHKHSLRRVDIEPAPLQHAGEPREPPEAKADDPGSSAALGNLLKATDKTLSADFRCATRVAEEPIPQLCTGQVLVRRMYAGVNASDVNFTAGRYFGSPDKSAERLPFDAGFEAVGVVAEVGPGVRGLKPGDAVAEMSFGAYSEWAVVEQKMVIPVPTCSPEIVALLTSGLTASIGLEAVGQMRSGETVLVTAAAGGTGQFVTQLAKAAGNHVVATCGSRDKAELLKQLGADRVINYRQEDVKEVLRREYQKGVDLVWESVGGEMFDTCVKSLATNGRLIVIGMMSQYGAGWKPSVNQGLLELLLWKSLSVRGFFLLHFARLFKSHLQKLAQHWMEGSMQVSIDPTSFVGVDRVADAVEHLQAGQSLGKVVVQLSGHLPREPAVSKL